MHDTELAVQYRWERWLGFDTTEETDVAHALRPSGPVTKKPYYLSEWEFRNSLQETWRIWPDYCEQKETASVVKAEALFRSISQSNESYRLSKGGFTNVLQQRSRIESAYRPRRGGGWGECPGALACACACTRMVLFIQHSTCMRHTVLLFVASLAPSYFPTLSHKRCEFETKTLNTERVSIFFTMFDWNISHSTRKKNSASYCHTRENVFM